MTIKDTNQSRIHVAALMAILLLGAGLCKAQSLSDRECTRVGLNPLMTPLWMVSGEWISDRSMVWVDAFGKEVLEVDAVTGEIFKLLLPWQDELEKRWNTQLKARARKEGVGRPLPQGPVRVRKQDERLLFEYAVPSSTIELERSAYKAEGLGQALDSPLDALEQSEVNLMNSRVSVSSARAAWREKAISATPPQIHSTYQFQEVADGHLAFASVRIPQPGQKPPLDFKESFVFITGDTFTDLMPDLGRFGVDDMTPSQIRQHQLFYMPYLAEASGVGYALLFGEKPKLVRYAPDGELTVLSLPGDLSRPMLRPDPSLSPLENDIRDYLKIERSDMAMGLYAVNERIFVLAKNSAPGGNVAWWMIELDPLTGEVRRRLQLPARGDAEHLTLIPGPVHVAIVEKSAVQMLNDRLYFETLSVATFPTGWLTTRNEIWNPLLGSTAVACQ